MKNIFNCKNDCSFITIIIKNAIIFFLTSTSIMALLLLLSGIVIFFHDKGFNDIYTFTLLFTYISSILLTIYIFLLNVFVKLVKIKYYILSSIMLFIGINFVLLTYIFINYFTLFYLETMWIAFFIIVNILFSFAIAVSATVMILYNHQTIKNERAFQKEKKLREEIEQRLYTSQINPHFLFNSLNLILNLLDNKELAEETIIKLSSLLRIILDKSEENIVTLEHELSIVKTYLEIQKMRFGKRLDFQIQSNENIQLPPLTILTIVENSIKHVLPEQNYLKITISTSIKTIKNKKIGTITIYDSERALKPEMIGKGRGLQIIIKRLELRKASFDIIDGAVVIEVPLDYTNNSLHG